MNGTLILPLFLALVAFAVFRLLSRSKLGKTSKTSDARLNRIKFVSGLFQWMIAIYVGMVILLMFGCWFGWVAVLPGTTRIWFSEHQTFTAPFNIPTPVLTLASIRFGLMVFCAGVMFRLLGLYRQGKYFTARNISYLRFLGYYVVVDWFVTNQLETLAQQTTIFLTQPIIGLAIIFIAWIMDEGRKIQEEQALTV